VTHEDTGKASGLAAADVHPQARGAHWQNGGTEEACHAQCNPTSSRSLCDSQALFAIALRRGTTVPCNLLRDLSGATCSETCVVGPAPRPAPCVLRLDLRRAHMPLQMMMPFNCSCRNKNNTARPIDDDRKTPLRVTLVILPVDDDTAQVLQVRVPGVAVIWVESWIRQDAEACRVVETHSCVKIRVQNASQDEEACRVGEIHSGIKSKVGNDCDWVGGHFMSEIFDNVKYNEVCEAESV
jgi:hypothetical protein